MSDQLRDFLIQRRVALGLSQRELARKAQVSHTVISRFELGNAHPNTSTLESISNALGVPFNRMFTQSMPTQSPSLNENLFDSDSLSELSPLEQEVFRKLKQKERQLEAKLKTTLQEKELLLHAAGEGLYGLDLEGRTTFVNPAAAKMIGWEPEELIGKPLHEILHHSKPDGSFYIREECPIYQAFKDGQIHQVDHEVFWRKDGSNFPVEYISTPILSEKGTILGAVVTFKDITHRKNVAQKLKESELKFRVLADSLPQIIFNTDPQGNLSFLNAAGLSYFDLSHQSFEGCRWFQCIHPEDIQPVIEIWTETINKKRSGSFECRLKQKSMLYKRFQVTLSAINDSEGNISLWSGYATCLE